MTTFFTVLGSIISGGALLTFIQFLITRHDSKKGKIAEIMAAIEKISSGLSRLEDKQAETEARNARIRILRCSDEIRHKQRHSKEYFDQINQDITDYERFCESHPGYKNNRATQAIQNVNRVYAELLTTNDFL